MSFVEVNVAWDSFVFNCFIYKEKGKKIWIILFNMQSNIIEKPVPNKKLFAGWL